MFTQHASSCMDCHMLIILRWRQLGACRQCRAECSQGRAVAAVWAA